MATTYKTIDYLPDLTSSKMSSAGIFSFEPSSSNSIGWDNTATYFSSAPDALLRDTFQWQGLEGATYDIFSSSYFDPFLVRVYDTLGNTIAVDTDATSYDSSSNIFLTDFVAPYTGTYYVSAGWHQGMADSNKFVYLSIYEDVDTAVNSIAVNHNTDTSVADSAVNHIPTGEIIISGTVQQDENLTVTNTLADEDGLGDFEYQWLRDGDEIFDATLETYKLSVSDIGKTISVKVNYIDGEGTLETATSKPSAVVIAKGASDGNDLLIGTNGNDKISALAGNDTLVGGLGKDSLTGNSGADIFKFNASNETGKTSATRDVITDFKHAEGDKIDLSGIDANSTSYGDQAFKFIGSKSFSGKAGELRFDSTNKILYGNLNNDKVPDFAIQLTGVKSLMVDDFIL